MHVNYPEPHIGRTKKILQAHPELKSLFGNTPSTAIFLVGIVAVQVGVAYLLKASPWWLILAGSYTVGAVLCHALWTLIHECTHNLVFKNSDANRVFQIIANLPICYPAAISFRTFHLYHHRYQGDINMDADLAVPIESKFAGNTVIGKALWLLFFVVFQPMRVSRMNIKFFTGWTALNIVTQVAFCTAITAAFGWPALGYLFLSSIFAVGLHPMGARWIQEHYTMPDNTKCENQETYSYYGPLNNVAFNVGFHNEHHDLMMVPWSRLPQVRQMAPEFYDTLYSHNSWTKLLFRFLFDNRISLQSRISRDLREIKPVSVLHSSLGVTTPVSAPITGDKQA